jgi:hypothetical protein
MQGAARGPRRYRYYVSRSLVRGEAKEAGTGWRVSAPELERAVTSAVEGMLTDSSLLVQGLDEGGIEIGQLPRAIESAAHGLERLRARGGPGAVLAELVERVDLKHDRVGVALRLPLLSRDPEKQADFITLKRSVPMTLQRRGFELRMMLEGDSIPGGVEPALLKAVARAHSWGR